VDSCIRPVVVAPPPHLRTSVVALIIKKDKMVRRVVVGVVAQMEPRTLRVVQGLLESGLQGATVPIQRPARVAVAARVRLAQTG